jgi:hypothetical protein
MHNIHGLFHLPLFCGNLGQDAAGPLLDPIPLLLGYAAVQYGSWCLTAKAH